jgi:hypothetical protein
VLLQSLAIKKLIVSTAIFAGLGLVVFNTNDQVVNDSTYAASGMSGVVCGAGWDSDCQNNFNTTKDHPGNYCPQTTQYWTAIAFLMSGGTNSRGPISGNGSAANCQAARGSVQAFNVQNVSGSCGIWGLSQSCSSSVLCTFCAGVPQH